MTGVRLWGEVGQEGEGRKGEQAVAEAIEGKSEHR